MYTLGIHSGRHDAAACLFRDYELVAAVSLERLTRKKNDGVTPQAEIPLAAIDECLRIAEIGRGDIDVICLSRAAFEVQSYKLRGRWQIKQLLYRFCPPRLEMMFDMLRRTRTRDAQLIFDHNSFNRRYGFLKADIHFYNHHAAHGIAAYFFSQFDHALIYTADGIGDNISYSARVANGGDIQLVHGDNSRMHEKYEVNSIALLYGHFTKELGFTWNRHEGKVTGLSAFGKPIAAEEILQHFSVDPEGRVHSDFLTYETMHAFARDMPEAVARGCCRIGTGSRGETY